MKNIFILNTDKPSRLFYNVEGALLYTTYQNYNGVNLYITSDENIVFNDFITDGYNVWQWKDDSSLLGRKKIILTTDENLITKGVQSIDEEFLQWFVKNPTCTKVEVDVVIVKPHYSFPREGINHYNIIMPKKPETFAELFANTDINTTKDANGNTHYHFKAIKKDNPPPAWLDIKEVNMLQEYKAVKKKAYCKYCLSTTNCCDDIEAETCEDYLKSSDSIIKKAAEKYAIEEWEDLYNHVGLTGAERGWETITDFIAGAKSDAAKNYWFEQFEKK